MARAKDPNQSGPDTTDTTPAPAAPVATEPGCQHPDCVLTHPHDGPAILAGTDAERAALQRVRAARTELAAAQSAAAALLPAGGYVIAVDRLYVHGGARAHNRGDRVPVGNVERNGWTEQVRPPRDGE